ncbi:type II toxin-antitoxin system RelE/ParE family toxin [Qipengyuania sp. ASV99]|uniref:type II toxin-antitoxin system RelE/ParE family toxin n=1 Tax=Qipengyuania sp. ASV99 TaxID=3399681 RepID=UPI003A4C7BD7
MPLVIRPEALRDLANVWSYTAKAWGTEQADIYIGEINDCMNKLLDFPEMGGRVDGLPSEYRKFPARSHRVIYRVSEADLIVVRVVHKREDMPDDPDGDGEE